MMTLKNVIVLCLTGFIGAAFANEALIFPVTSQRLKSEMDATLNKMTVKSAAAVETLKLYQSLEQHFSVVGLTVLRILRQKKDERFGSSQEAIVKAFDSARKITSEVGLVGPYLQAALGELSRLKSWRDTANNNLESQATQTFNNFGSLPYFCRKFFTRIRGYEGLTLYLAKAQQKITPQSGEVKATNDQLVKLLDYLEQHYKDETKQAKTYVDEVWNKDIRTIVKAEMYMEHNADMKFDDALEKGRAATDDGGSKLQNTYEWIREDEHYFHCAPFNGKDVFEAANEAHKENGALVGISRGGYLLIANTVLLLTACSI